MTSSINHATMHGLNMALVLDTLRVRAPISRTEIATLTGLNKGTVSTIVRTLLKNNFVVEAGLVTSTSDVGRPSMNLELNPAAGAMISAEIGVGFISSITTNFKLDITERHFERIQNPLYSAEAVLEMAIQQFRAIEQGLQARQERIFGIAVGLPGLVDSDGNLLFAPNLGWRDIPIKDIVQAEFPDYPVYVDNEANLAAQGESYAGKHRSGQVILCIVAGIGLGSGIVLNGKLLQGVSGFAGEVGHMTVNPNGEHCNCGNIGCWETLASERAVFQHIERRIASGERSLLMDMTGSNIASLSMPLIVEAAAQGDTVARAALEDAGHWLGVGIANLINIFNPDNVILGGTLSLAHETLLPIIQEEVKKRALSWPQAHSRIDVAARIADACVVGGAALIHHRVVDNPSEWITE